MAASQYYIDPSIDAASGAGTIGDPYGDLQHALDTVTRNTSNGDQMNIKAGTAEVLTAAISLATYGTPDGNHPLTFRGYTSALADGGIGEISGAATYSIFSSSTNGIRFVDMHFTNSGASTIVTTGSNCVFLNCEFDNTSGGGLVGSYETLVSNCYFHNIGAIGLVLETGLVIDCVFETGSGNDFTVAIETNQQQNVIDRCIFILAGSAIGIQLDAAACRVVNNTLYATTGTGTAIKSTVWFANVQTIENNYIEGFSGVGGVGINTESDVFGDGGYIVRNNKYYNNTTNESLSGLNVIYENNAAVGSSALTNPGTGDFSVGTDLKAAGFPTAFNGISTNQFIDVGAAQREEVAAAAAIVLQGRHNVLLRR